jgi:hypothetical protein
MEKRKYFPFPESKSCHPVTIPTEICRLLVVVEVVMMVVLVAAAAVVIIIVAGVIVVVVVALLLLVVVVVVVVVELSQNQYGLHWRCREQNLIEILPVVSVLYLHIYGYSDKHEETNIFFSNVLNAT